MTWLPPDRNAAAERARFIMRDGFAAAKFKEQFGEWPRQEWV